MKKRWSVNMMVTVAMMVALEVVLSRFLSIQAWNTKIGLNFIPMVVLGILYGAVPAGVGGLLADLIGSILFPSAAFFPGYTLNAFLRAFFYGLLLHKKQTTVRIAVVVAIQLVLTLFLQSLWISIQYGSPYWGLVVSRVPQAAIMMVVQFFCIQVIARTMSKLNRGAKK